MESVLVMVRMMSYAIVERTYVSDTLSEVVENA
jgi:hypothetical protein